MVLGLENGRDCGDGLLIARRPKQQERFIIIIADMVASSGCVQDGAVTFLLERYATSCKFRRSYV